MRPDRLGFGIFLAPFHALHEDPTAAMDRDMDLLVHLDQLGYDEAWVGEHHSGGFEIIAAPEIFIAAAAERTRHIRLGTGVTSLPYHHPFMAADRMVQLDHMTKGRVMFGVGPGALSGDAFQMGIDPADQRRRMNEALDAIMALFRGERVDMKTDWFELRGAKLQIESYTRPHIEMAVACARSPVGAVAAGKHGLGMLSIGGTSDDAMKAHKNNWATCEESALEHQQQVDRSKWRLVSLMHIAETREQARENIRHGLELWAKYFREVATFPIVPAGIDNAYDFLLENKLACIGTPDDAIAYIENLLEGSGGFGSFLELAHNWADFDATKRHYELMTRYVRPHFQNTLQGRTTSYEYSHSNRELFVGAAAKAIQTEIEKRQAEKG